MAIPLSHAIFGQKILFLSHLSYLFIGCFNKKFSFYDLIPYIMEPKEISKGYPFPLASLFVFRN